MFMDFRFSLYTLLKRQCHNIFAYTLWEDLYFAKYLRRFHLLDPDPYIKYRSVSSRDSNMDPPRSGSKSLVIMVVGLKLPFTLWLMNYSCWCDYCVYNAVVLQLLCESCVYNSVVLQLLVRQLCL